MKKTELLKKMAPALIIFIVIFLAYKFVAWNYWKVERAVKLGKAILAAAPAVNLSLILDDKTLYRQGFAHNPHGNYYLVNRFDISPYIGDDSQLEFYINREKTAPLSVHRFKTFNLITCRDCYFVFTTPACTIDEFVELRKTLPGIIKTLSGVWNEDHK